YFLSLSILFFFFFQAEDGIRDKLVTGVQTCALPIFPVILGGVIAFQVAHVFNLGTFLLTILGASLIQIATNMLNDYFDFKSGNDLQVKHQNPFAGGGRILTAGLVKPSTHIFVATTCLVLGSLIG